MPTVTVLAYDELFERLRRSGELLRNGSALQRKNAVEPARRGLRPGGVPFQAFGALRLRPRRGALRVAGNNDDYHFGRPRELCCLLDQMPRRSR
jgi:hypothetical protein